MTREILAHFDGKAIIPDEPVDLPLGRVLQVRVTVAEPAPPHFADFLDLAADLPGAPPDLSAQHDHYLYGSPKR